MHHPSLACNQRRQSIQLALIPFNPAHLDLLAWRLFDKEYTTKLPSFNAQIQTFCADSLGVTVLADGRIIACGGVFNMGSGIAYTWMFGSIYLQRHSLNFIKELDVWLSSIEKTLKLHRLQTVCHVDDIQGRKWVEGIGFVAEGTLNSYDANRGNYIMYARIKGREA